MKLFFFFLFILNLFLFAQESTISTLEGEEKTCCKKEIEEKIKQLKTSIQNPAEEKKRIHEKMKELNAKLRAIRAMKKKKSSQTQESSQKIATEISTLEFQSQWIILEKEYIFITNSPKEWLFQKEKELKILEEGYRSYLEGRRKLEEVLLEKETALAENQQKFEEIKKQLETLQLSLNEKEKKIKAIGKPYLVQSYNQNTKKYTAKFGNLAWVEFTQEIDRDKYVEEQKEFFKNLTQEVSYLTQQISETKKQLESTLKELEFTQNEVNQSKKKLRAYDQEWCKKLLAPTSELEPTPTATEEVKEAEPEPEPSKELKFDLGPKYWILYPFKHKVGSGLPWLTMLAERSLSPLLGAALQAHTVVLTANYKYNPETKVYDLQNPIGVNFFLVGSEFGPSESFKQIYPSFEKDMKETNKEFWEEISGDQQQKMLALVLWQKAKVLKAIQEKKESSDIPLTLPK